MRVNRRSREARLHGRHRKDITQLSAQARRSSSHEGQRCRSDRDRRTGRREEIRMTARYRPIVLITCSHTEFAVPGIGPLYHHTVFERYVDAAASTLDCTPLPLPALTGHSDALADCIRLADGALLTGDASNVG